MLHNIHGFWGLTWTYTGAITVSTTIYHLTPKHSHPSHVQIHSFYLESPKDSTKYINSNFKSHIKTSRCPYLNATKLGIDKTVDIIHPKAKQKQKQKPFSVDLRK